MPTKPGDDLPTRLIDVGPSNGSYPPKLYLSASLARTSSARLDYVALSYCWGSTQNSALTTSENVVERMKGIDMDSLPKTIRDAIWMTRVLGLRYLWVDALCIIQPTDGNSADWDIESLCMAAYYQHAILTFAAAVGDESSDGLWREESVPPSRWQTFRSPRSLFDLKNRRNYDIIRLTNPDPSWRRGVQRSTLRGRGWTLQELILSSRIIYWTSDGIYWDCCGSIASEYKPSGLLFNEYDQLDPVREMRLQFTRARNPANFAHVLDRWYSIVAKYSHMELSYNTDKLPAISGIAKTVQKLTQNEMQYAAGIWINSHNSWFDLAWRVAFDGTRCPTATVRETSSSYVAPSWSWASVVAPVIYLDGGRQQGRLNRGMADPSFKIQGVKLRLSGDDTMGQLQSGTIHLRGIMPTCVKAVLEANPTDPHHWFEQKGSGSVDDSIGQLFRRTNCYFDKEVYEVESPRELTCLMIGNLHQWCYGILLEVVPHFDRRFRRIGIVQRHVTNPFDSKTEQDIELV
jgi:hypothetical protein